MRKLVSAVAGALLLSSGAVLVPATAAPTTTPYVDTTLRAALAKSAATDRLPVKIHAASVKTATTAAAAKGLQVVTTFDKVGVAVAAGTPAQIRSLARVPGLTRLEGDRPFEYHLDTAHEATRMAEARAAAATSGFDGTGVTIAVVDSGIDGTHPMFQQGGKSKVVRNLKLTCTALTVCMGTQGNADERMFTDVTKAGNNTDTMSAGGHGTHVAGIAAGVPVTTKDGRRLSGAAPGAKLVGLAVGSGYAGYYADTGLNWVLEHHAKPCVDGAGKAYSHPVDCPPIKVVNLSLGPTGGGEFEPGGSTSKLQQALVAAGVTVVWSAGNGDAANVGGDGSDNRTSPYGSDPTPGVLMVANYDDGNNGTREGALDASSSRGRYGRPSTYPDVSAPGADITSACRPHLTYCQFLGGHVTMASDADYGTIGGSSMAAPYVAGVVADMVQANPSITPAQAEAAIEDTAHRFAFGAPYESDPTNPSTPTSFDKGHGLVDAAGAIALARGLSAPSAPTQCVVGSPAFKDNAGDSGLLSLTDYTGPEPQADVTSAHISYDGAALNFVIKVVNLEATNPHLGNGLFWELRFFYKGSEYYVRASRSLQNGNVFQLRKGDNTVISAVDGSFDVLNDTVNVHVPGSKLPSAPVNGDVVQATTLGGYRHTGNGGVGVDTAKTYCARYVVGGGTAGVPATPTSSLPKRYEPAVGQPHGAVSTSSQAYGFSGKVATTSPLPIADAFLFGGGCADFEDDACVHRFVNVQVPAGGGTLTYTVSFSAPNDLDIYLYDPDGVRIGGVEGATAETTETITERVAKSGVYTLQFLPYSAVEADYTASLRLS